MNPKMQTYPTTELIKNFIFAETEGLKKSIHNWCSENLSNKPAIHSILAGFENCLRGISGLEQTLRYLDDGVVVLFGTDIPQKLERDLVAVSKIAGQNTHLYLGYLASVGIISTRYSRVQAITHRLSAKGREQLSDSNQERTTLQKQLLELKRDFIILAETDLLLLERIMPMFHGAAITQMRQRLYQTI